MLYKPLKTKSLQAKIAFDAKRAFHNSTGLGNYSRDLIRAVAKNGHQIGLFTPKGGNYAHLFENEVYKIHSPKGLGKALPSLWRSFGIVKELEQSDYTHYHGLSAELPFGIERWKGKKILTIHDLIFENYPKWYAPLDRRMYSRKAKYACKVADAIIAISHETSADIQRLYGVAPEKIHVIPPMCHDFFYEKEINPRPTHLPEKYMLYVGSIEPRKNLKYVVQALAKSSLTMPLVVVGKIHKKYFEEFKAEWQALQKANKLFHLQANMEELVALYDHCSFLVYPSQAEGYGLPVMEAAHRAKPSIVGPSPCLQEAGGEAAYVLHDVNEESLLAAMEHFWKDEQALEKAQKMVQQHAQNFSRERILSDLGVLYTRA